MRLTGLRLKGLTTAFPNEISVDFDALPRIVAVVGDNAAGKTTMLESVVAALYRRLRSRDGSLYEYVSGEAFVEAAFRDGAGDKVVATLQVDGPRKKTEQQLVVNGRPLTTGREAEVAAEVRARFGSIDLLSASVFQSQDRRGDLVSKPRADRKALFGELLDLGRYGKMAKSATNQAAALETRLAELRSDVEGLAAASLEIQDLRASVLAAETTVASSAQDAAQASERLTQARARLQEAEVAAARTEGLRRAWSQANDAHAQAKAAAVAAADRLAAAGRALAAARDRQASLGKSLDERKARAEKLLSQTAAEISAIAGRLPFAKESAEAARVQAHDAWVRVQEGKAARETLANAQSNLRSAQASVSTERKHLKESASLLDRVPCTRAKEWVDVDAEAHPSDDVAFTDLASTCPLLAAARLSRDRLPSVDVDASVTEAFDSALDMEKLFPPQADLERLHQEASQRAERARNILTTIQGELNGHERSKAMAETDLRHIDEERKKSGPVILRDIEAAANEQDAALQRRDIADSAAAETLAAVGRAHAELPSEAIDVSGPRVEVTNAQRDEKATAQTLEHWRDTLATLRGKLEVSEARVLKMNGSAEAAANIGDDLADWRLIEGALGPNGIQAFEVDGAGPAVAAIVNELLTCWSTRFTLKFETLREKSGGGFQEVFDILVYDNEANGWRKVEDLSGGEQAFLKEAISQGIAIFNARQSGRAWKTCFRDEADGQLSESNAIAYLAMLRKMLDLGGFEQVIFITHRRVLWERADACLYVSGGTVRLADADEISISAAPAA